jgi:N-acetylglucosamine kinase-like BadF-type ATPase
MNHGTNLQYKRILGVDGGGSKTIAWIADVVRSSGQLTFDLEILGRGHSGPSNPRSVGFDEAFTNLENAIAMAREQLPATSTTNNSAMNVACLSLAGAGRREEQDRIQEWADANCLAEQTIVIDDVEPLRFAAMYEQSQLRDFNPASWVNSITLVVGTGSIAYGRNGARLSIRAGGWGYLLGDEGSGFSIGLAGLQAICKGHDRGEAATAFRKAMLQRIGVSSPTDLVPFMYQAPLPRAQVAELSEVVIGYAASDLTAEKILVDAIQAMTELVSTAAQRLELEHRSYSLALSGGIVCNHPVVVSRLMQALELKQLTPLALHIVREPIYGALFLATQSSRRAPSSSTLE